VRISRTWLSSRWFARTWARRWQAVARVSELRLGEKVFTSGFADPNPWSNSAGTTELGVNWYWNEFFKICAFWLRAEFGDPVLFRPGGLQKNADMF
jgi:phosphate-selective porin OprO/OprP